MLFRTALVAAPLAFALAAAAQTAASPAAKRTPPPPGWMEKWVGLWATDPAPRRTRTDGGGNPDYGLDEIVVPLSQPWALARRDATDFEIEDAGQVCRPTGLFRAGSGGAIEFLASPEKITLIARGGGGMLTGGIRRIYLNRPHSKNPPLTYNGDSVAHWEGDTLVIDTIGFNDKTWLSGRATRHSEALHVVERLRFLDKDSIEHLYTVDDRFALTAPYTFTRHHRRQTPDTPIAENLCQDSPDSRRGWIRLYQRSLADWETRRAAPPAAVQ
jgi:hypothetical protein